MQYARAKGREVDYDNMPPETVEGFYRTVRARMARIGPDGADATKATT